MVVHLKYTFTEVYHDNHISIKQKKISTMKKPVRLVNSSSTTIVKAQYQLKVQKMEGGVTTSTV